MKKGLFYKIFLALLFVLSLGIMAKGQTADLVITNAVTHHQASGQFTNFIITIRNNGPNTATNVKVTDVLTTAWNFANPASNHKASHGNLNTSGTQNRNLEWNIPYIPNGGVAVLIFRATNNNNNWDNPPYTTTASITGMNQTDPNLSNNSATTTSTNGSTSTHSLSLVQTVNNLTPNVGDLVQFTISLNRINAGTSVALQVTDKLPPGFSYQNHTVSNGTYNSSTGIWNLTENSHYFSSNPHTLVINATVLPPTGAPDEYKNIAAITSVALDVDIANDMSIVSVAPLSALPPEAVNDNASTGQDIPVDIDILNNDTYSTLSAITITQQPANGQNITFNSLTDVTYTPNNGYNGPDSFKYTITDENGTSGEATVNLDVVPVVAPTAVADAVSAIKNETKIINVLANDNQGSGAFDEVAIVSQPTHGNVIVNPNNTVSYTPNTNYTGADSFQYEVTNIHNITSNTATVSINVLDPVGLVTWNGAGGGFAPHITASHVTASNITSVGATMTNNGQYSQYFQTGGWPNPSEYGGYLNESRYVQFTITANANYKIDLNQFNFEVQMDGGTANYEVRYSKDFSQGYSSFNGTIDGSWAAKSGSLSDMNSVLPGETVYIRLYLYNTHNSVRIRHSWGGSTGPTITGAVSQYVTADPADLKITKTMDNDTPNVGDEVTYTIVVENLDPSNTAAGVVVIDQLPAGFEYVSDDSGGSYDEGTGIWTVGNLAHGASATLEITAKKQGTGPYTNTATVSHNGSDSNSANNSASVTPSNACANCTHLIPNGGGNITVNSGQIFCLHSGTYTGTVTLNSGGTICIGEGATFSPSWGPNTYEGIIINHGTTNFFTYNTANYHPKITNYGIFNSTNLQNFAGSIENKEGGVVNMTAGDAVFLAGSEIINRGDMTLNKFNGTDVEITNYSNLTVENNFYFSGEDGYFENKSGATVTINQNNGNTNITSQFDNSGTAKIYKANSGTGISTVVNNYGTMEFHDGIIFGLDTYLTNDGILEFYNSGVVQFQGPLLQNNNQLTVHDNGDLALNSPISQMVNNKRVVVEGAISHNVSGSSITNNCTIISEDYIVGNGTSNNNGLIWVNDEFKFEGNTTGAQSILINGTTGFVRGVNFRNSGDIRGYGSFYFTGTTNFESAGTFIGDDPNSPIQFYDTTPTTGGIFDTYVQDNPAINVIRPVDPMIPYDDTNYNCSAPPTTAGYPPQTEEIAIATCERQTISFPITNYVQPHEDVNGNQFTLAFTTIRFFDANNENNSTNNSTSLTIAGKGTLSVNTSTGVVTFTPNVAFTNGDTFEAEYRISNTWSGNPSTMPSSKIPITFSIHNLPDIEVESGDNPLCIGDSLILSNDVEGGGWASSAPAIAMIDQDGVVTGVSAGTAIISYTVTFPSFPEGQTCTIKKELLLDVQNCTPATTRKVISNPMLRNRAKTN